MKYQPQSARPNAGHQCTPPPPVEMLRAQVCSNGELSFLMEAHDGLSATIAQRSGFKGLWASGLSIACSLGYRDANEASWSQLVDAVERIVDSSQLPVLVDGDGGFGNFERFSSKMTTVKIGFGKALSRFRNVGLRLLLDA